MKKALPKPLASEFYQRDTRKVAKELLGKRLFHRSEGQLTSGIIIETEAYLGAKDPAAHSFENHRSARVESMYKAGGHSYVYFIYGNHFCFNVVTRGEGEPEAVLVRALLPVDGIETMVQRRAKNNPKFLKITDQKKVLQQLCSGPGKLCQAMDIDRRFDGKNLLGQELWIAEDLDFSKVKKRVQSSARIGIDSAGHAVHWPLRYNLDLPWPEPNNLWRSNSPK